MKRSLACLSTCFLIQASIATAAEIRVASDQLDDRSVLLILDGAIEEGDFERFQAALASQNDQGIVVSGIILNSPGGAVLPALKIGRNIRQNRLVTYSPSTCEGGVCICASACALIWLGGIARTGTVYVHRPSLSEGEQQLTFDTWDSVVNAAQDTIELYLHEMRIPESVIETVFSTNPSDIAPIAAGKDVAVKDPLLEDYARTRCGPPLSDFQKTYLSTFEDYGDESVEDELSLIGVELLRVLREKATWLKDCTGEVLYMAQQEAQLGH